jgi:pimeloyl-ACP methyl ester carboxylesterase
MGTSMGGEAALILGAVYPDVVDSVVGLVPSANVDSSGSDPSWTLNGKALSFTRIPVERIRGHVFVVGGGDDRIWPSAGYVREIAKRLRAHGHGHATRSSTRAPDTA